MGGELDGLGGISYDRMICIGSGTDERKEYKAKFF